MSNRIITTSDGSLSIYVPDLDETYHSKHGAVQESMHIFIENGLRKMEGKKSIRILEIGFGTGLNVLLSLEESLKNGLEIQFNAVEKYPLDEFLYAQLSYTLDMEESDNFLQRIHQTPWDTPVSIVPNFQLTKINEDIRNFKINDKVDLVYFDAFSPVKQPKLWSVEVFKNMFELLEPGGILVTYCAQGQVKRNMKVAGFSIERLPGPPGKREMTRASKPL